MTVLPPPADAARVSCFLADHLRWSVYWDKKYGLWRVAEDDPDSDLYAESGCPEVLRSRYAYDFGQSRPGAKLFRGSD